VGAIIMTHGDDQGLILPPKLAPIQVVIVPIFKNEDEKSKVMAVVERVSKELEDFRVHVDDRTEMTPGFKFNDWELRGVPLRIEIGPRDVKNNSVAFARRDMPGKAGKSIVSQDQLADQVGQALAEIHIAIYERALSFREENTYEPKDYEELRDIVKNGWAYTWWCGSDECELKVKEDTRATTRCIPMDQPEGEGVCIVCSQPATKKVYFARAY
jgi:prolyl-tRNA synthetase